MPKLTAPREMRFAGVSPTRPQNAMSSASGMFSAVMRGGARVPEEEKQHDAHEKHPDEQVLEHRVRVSFTRLPRS